MQLCGLIDTPEVAVCFFRPQLGIIQESWVANPQLRYDVSMQRMLIPVEWVTPEGTEETKWVPLMNVAQHSTRGVFKCLEQPNTSLQFPKEWCRISRKHFVERVCMELGLVSFG